jgi:Tfp pilus assembly protein FimT
MTLMELLLVLALIVAVAALSLPAFEGPLQDQQLLKSADLVRAAWGKARIRAMESGRTQVFRYETNGSAYQTEPWRGDGDYLEMDLETMQSDPYALSGGPVAATTTEAAPEKLPEGILFHSAQVAADARAADANQMMMSVGAMGEEWSTPILFYADGTSSTVQVTMTNQRGNFVLVKLRGLTGVAQVSELLTAEELPQ